MQGIAVGAGGKLTYAHRQFGSPTRRTSARGRERFSRLFYLNSSGLRFIGGVAGPSLLTRPMWCTLTPGSPKAQCWECVVGICPFDAMGVGRRIVLIQTEVGRGRPRLVSIPSLRAHYSSTTSFRLSFRMARNPSAIGCNLQVELPTSRKGAA